jgi:hypothetical protein
LTVPFEGLLGLRHDESAEMISRRPTAAKRERYLEGKQKYRLGLLDTIARSNRHIKGFFRDQRRSSVSSSIKLYNL